MAASAFSTARARARSTSGDGDAVARITAAAAEIGGIEKRGVDEQCLAGIMGGHFEANLTRAFELITAGDFSPGAVNLLIEDWPPLANRAQIGMQHEIAISASSGRIGSL